MMEKSLNLCKNFIKYWSDGHYLRGAVGLTGLRFTSVGLGLVVTVILSRGLGVTDFGIFSFAISLATLLALPMTGGLPTLLMREISVAKAHSEPEKQAGVIKWGYRVTITISIVLALVAAAIWCIGQVADIWPWDARGNSVAVMVILLIPALSLQQVQRGILSGHQMVVRGGLGEQLLRPSLMALMLLSFGTLSLSKGPQIALALQLGATLGAIALTFLIMHRSLPRRSEVAVKILNREWLWALLPLTAISATTIVKNNTDIFMLGIMANPTDVGLYRIATQVSVLSMVAMQILRSLSAPRIAAAFANDDMGAMRRHFVKTGRLMFGASAIFVLAFAAFGRPSLIMIFGPDYADAWAPCMALALSALFSSACGFVGVALQVTKHAGLAARSAMVSAVVNIVLNLVLIPSFGALGAATATAVATMIMQTQQWLIARRVLNMRTDAFQRVDP